MFYWSRIRESNPPHLVGNQEFYRWTNPANFLLSVTNSMTISENAITESEKPLQIKGFDSGATIAWEAVVLPIYESCVCEGIIAEEDGKFNPFLSKNPAVLRTVRTWKENGKNPEESHKWPFQPYLFPTASAIIYGKVMKKVLLFRENPQYEWRISRFRKKALNFRIHCDTINVYRIYLSFRR